MGKKPQGEVKLTQAQLTKIIETASEVAIKQYRAEAEKEKQENRDKRLYNTRLLLEKYRGMAKYADDAVYDAQQIDDDMELQSLLELMSSKGDDGSLSVESIQSRAVRTKVILTHVRKMLDFYAYRCGASGKQEMLRKWDTVYNLYLAEEEKTVAELAETFFVDERTVYRYNKAAIQDLSALFFGSID